MSFTCSLFSDKVRCFNQSERALYGRFIITAYERRTIMAPQVSNKGYDSKRFSWEPGPKVRHCLVQSCELGANCTWFRPKVHSITCLPVQCRAHDNTAASSDIITWTLRYCTCFRRAACIWHSCGRSFESVMTLKMRFSWKVCRIKTRLVCSLKKIRRGREMVFGSAY